MAAIAPVPAHQGLLLTVLQQLRELSGGGIVVAITSSNSGEGVTHCVRSLITELSRDSMTRILHIDAQRLRELEVLPPDFSAVCMATDVRGVSVLDPARVSTGGNPGNLWDGNWQYRKACIEQMRKAFDYVVIDCPAIQESGEALVLAPVVDGVILVVEADKTRKDQIQRAEKSIEFARGKIIGHILNKRAYVVPDWVYRRL